MKKNPRTSGFRNGKIRSEGNCLHFDETWIAVQQSRSEYKKSGHSSFGNGGMDVWKVTNAVKFGIDGRSPPFFWPYLEPWNLFWGEKSNWKRSFLNNPGGKRHFKRRLESVAEVIRIIGKWLVLSNKMKWTQLRMKRSWNGYILERSLALRSCSKGMMLSIVLLLFQNHLSMSL